jgi:DNA-binding MarR family transcriptional regulator
VPSPPTTEADLRRAVRAIALAARKLERATGDLTLAQYRVLALVAGGDERSSLVAVVDGLVERGFVTREAVAGDRRALRLVVTKAGGRALAAAEVAMSEALDQVLGAATDRAGILTGLADLDGAMTAYFTERLRA